MGCQSCVRHHTKVQGYDVNLMSENRVASAGDIINFRKQNQKSQLRFYIRKPTSVYTATLNAIPSDNDMVIEISFANGTGTLGDVKVNMAILIGTTIGGHELGFARIRKTPIAGTFYIGETSEVNWSAGGTIYLTVVNDTIGIWPKHLKLVSQVPFMDADIAYSNQHTNFDPVVVMGTDRVAILTGASVSLNFDAADSWVYNSTISSYLWVAPGSSGSSGLNTATPTISYNAEGEYQVYCTVTAATGKTSTGVRTVFVDGGTLGYEGQLTSNPVSTISEGGWSCEVTVVGDVSGLMDFTKVVIATVDRFDNVETSIGPISGSENIELIGWIVEESITHNPKMQYTKFRVATSDQMIKNIPGFIHGLELSVGTSSAWTNMYGLTVDKSLWHMWHWRSTVDYCVDIKVTEDTRYIKETTTPAGNLWQQFTQLLASTIAANLACDRYSRVIAQIEPQLVPVASRTWDTIRTLEGQDWHGDISYQMSAMPKSGRVYLDGLSISIEGQGRAFFSLAPGHVPKRFGALDSMTSLLLTDQAQANELTGAILAWRNNRYRDITVDLAANDRYADITPNMYFEGTFYDTRRDRTISGNFIPRRVERVWNKNTGALTTSVSLELAVEPDINANGDIPDGGGDIPDTPWHPPGLPPLPPIVLPPIGGSDGDSLGPRFFLFESSNKGFLYTLNCNATSPNWLYMNNGFPPEYIAYVKRVVKTPSGALFALVADPTTVRGADYIYWATGLGGTWKLLTSAVALGVGRLLAIGADPTVTERIGVAASNGNNAGRFYLGDRNGISLVASGLDAATRLGDVTFGSGKWFLSHAEDNIFGNQAWSRFAGGGGMEVNTQNLAGQTYSDANHFHRRGGDFVYWWNTDTRFLRRVENNDGATSVVLSTSVIGALGYGSFNFVSVSPTGQKLIGGKNTVIGHRSSDFGATWGPCDPALGVGYHVWENCASESYFMAATTQSIKMTPDFGTTWIDKSGDLPTIAPLSAALHLLFIGW